VGGCGATATSSAGGTTAIEMTHDPVDLAFQTVDGGVVELADQRGGLVLLFVLATYDGLSHAAIRPVSRFTRDHEDTVVLGVVVERDAASFAPIYRDTFVPPYTVVYDESGQVAEGTSPLGELPGVPSFYMIDARGVVSERRTGFLSEAELAAMHDRAASHGGIAP
jgi:hypothetical protein